MRDDRGEPWFVAADVCAVLGIGNPTDALQRLDADERTLVSIEGASNGKPVNAINESGLYSLILGSRKLTKSQLAVAGAKLKAWHAVKAKERQLEALKTSGKRGGKVPANLPGPIEEGDARDQAAKAVGTGEGLNHGRKIALTMRPNLRVCAVPERPHRTTAQNLAVHALR